MTANPILSAPTYEQHHDGFGIGNSVPRISWKFITSDTDIKDWEQSAYELELSRGKKESIESYRVESHESVLVPWPSQPLESREQVSVRVRSFKKGLEKESTGSTEWSPWSTVEAGLLKKSDWTSQLISASASAYEDGPLRPVRFRRTFSISDSLKNVAKARLYITCFGIYEAYINGVRVGDQHMSPGWTSYNHRLNYQTFDVASMLKKGDNVIAFEIAEGWYATRLLWRAGRRYTYGRDLCILSQLEVTFGASGQLLTINSDSSWRRHDSPILRSELYDGEFYDMREENLDWNRLMDSSNEDWGVTETKGFPDMELVSPNAPPVRVIEEITPVKIFKSKSGKTLIDFGQNLVGRVHVASLKKPSGHKIVFQHAEVLDNGELGIRTLRCAKATNTIICSGEELKNWTPRFTFQGFRYVQVDGWTPEDESDPLTTNKIKALVLHTDLERTGWFSCSNKMVNKLHSNALWSMRGNFLSIPTDCPQRDERLGWTGDIQIFGPSAAYLYDTAGMLGNWLEDVAVDQADAKAVPPVVIPNILVDDFKDMPQAAWCDVVVLLPWALYKASGDLEILRRQYPSMSSWLDKGLPRGTDRLWDPEVWQLGDWLDPAAPPEDPAKSVTDATFVADAYLVHIAFLISQISGLLEESDDHKRYTAEHAQLKRTFQQKYITPSGLVLSDTQTAYALVLAFSLHETNEQVAFASQRLARLVKVAKFKVSCGFVGTPLITHALSKTALNQLAYRMLLEEKCPSWLYPVTMGATTMWERWDSMLPDGSINKGEMTSFNHYALGSVINWMHESIAGISPMEPGWKRILVRPTPGGDLSSAEARFESPYGLIKSSWTIQDQKFVLSLQVPPNSTAWVVMPDAQNKTAGSGLVERGVLVGSGQHEFSCITDSGVWPPEPIYMPWEHKKEHLC